LTIITVAVASPVGDGELAAVDGLDGGVGAVLRAGGVRVPQPHVLASTARSDILRHAVDEDLRSSSRHLVESYAISPNNAG
jgi:hypothetical protein